jgi:hypothetical protein
METGAHVRAVLTPEQWALAMWGRGDIEVDVEWTDMEKIREEQR